MSIPHILHKGILFAGGHQGRPKCLPVESWLLQAWNPDHPMHLRPNASVDGRSPEGEAYLSEFHLKFPLCKGFGKVQVATPFAFSAGEVSHSDFGGPATPPQTRRRSTTCVSL